MSKFFEDWEEAVDNDHPMFDRSLLLMQQYENKYYPDYEGCFFFTYPHEDEDSWCPPWANIEQDYWGAKPYTRFYVGKKWLEARLKLADDTPREIVDDFIEDLQWEDFYSFNSE